MVMGRPFVCRSYTTSPVRLTGAHEEPQLRDMCGMEVTLGTLPLLFVYM